jgi:hypothetical protein
MYTAKDRPEAVCRSFDKGREELLPELPRVDGVLWRTQARARRADWFTVGRGPYTNACSADGSITT